MSSYMSLTGDCIIVNRRLASTFGLECAAVMAELVSCAAVYSVQHTVSGWFTADMLHERVGLTKSACTKAVKKLRANDLIDYQGDGDRRRYLIYFENVVDAMDGLIDVIEKEPPKRDPKREAEVTEVIEYLNAATGTNYRTGAETTRKLIRTRMGEGYTVQEFKRVIDQKVSEWSGTQWAKFIRPSTIFGTKFAEYLNQISGAVDNEDFSSYDRV
jgi:uncharacterized phage protein (TIGR02220 family)